MLDVQPPIVPLLAVKVKDPPAIICWFDAVIENVVGAEEAVQFVVPNPSQSPAPPAHERALRHAM